MQQVTKAVLAAAGQGTRFLPQTKASPKEMMPVINKPVIQYVVDELVEAGITDIIIVTGSHKRAIEDHFDRPSLELAEALSSPKKRPFLDEVNRIADMANFVYVRQKGPAGNATPLANVASLIGDEPFIYGWADEFFLGEGNRFKEMIEAHNKHQGGILSCKPVENDVEYGAYGIVSGQQVADGVIDMDTIIEKPGVDAAPSNMASVASYIMPAGFADAITQDLKTYDPSQGEFNIQPTIQRLIDSGNDKFYGVTIKGARYCDCGTPENYLKTINYAAKLAGYKI